jgi:GGDEF domain-containing protein
MPDEELQKSPDAGELQQAAVHCYLSTILAIADCMAELCPGAGVAFKNRWRRLPQRIAFDLSPQALEVSRRTFEMDIRTFSEFAGQYYNQGVPLIDSIATDGMQLADTVLERTARHIVLLETLAESIETAADLDSTRETREMLEHQSAGIRTCASQAQTELLPLVSRFRELVKECEKIVSISKSSNVVDRETGFLNSSGFKQEHELRMREATPSCLLIIDCSARLQGGPECTDAQFSQIIEAISARVSQQFRPNDSIARLARNRFAIIFDGEMEQAQGRLEQMQRSISGKYASPAGKMIVTAELRLFESRDEQAIQEALSSVEQRVSAPAGA